MSSVEEQLRAAGLELAGDCSALAEPAVFDVQDAMLLEDFSADESAILGAAMPRLRAAPRQVLIREGESGNWMLLLLVGTVDVTKRRPDGNASRLAVVKAGATLGEMSMFDGEPRNATCTAIEAVECGLLTREAIATLIRDHPAVGAKLLVKLTQLVAQRLRNTNNQLLRLLQERTSDEAAPPPNQRLNR
jgi:CRP/FNR family cyclic AMP-dependent transcriptional regulator